MPKTKRDLLWAVAEKIGGEHAKKLPAALQKKSVIDDLLDRPMSDEAFASPLQKIEHDLPIALDRMQGISWAKSDKWSLN